MEFRRRIGAFLCAFGVLSAGYFVRAQCSAVHISAVAVVDGEIRITGRNFGSAPTVVVDDQTTWVSSSSWAHRKRCGAAGGLTVLD
jgi:hypothetical protein